MTIEIEGSGLPPLRPKKEPLIALGGVVAVDAVRLVARDVPRRKLSEFYVDLLGFAPDEPGGGADLAYKFEKFRLEFVRTGPADLGLDLEAGRPGKLVLIVKQFASALRVLGDLRIPFEREHYDLGLCRAASCMDPAGNLVMLVENRPL